MTQKYLVIVEAPNKVKSYSKYLGPEYKVVATVGHVIDLPPKGKNYKAIKDKTTGKYTFVPNYDIIQGKEDIVRNIVSIAPKYQIIYLMLDSDREGEAIAWHVFNKLPPNLNVKRASTNSITKNDIAKAIKNAGSINADLVSAYETRRILDRMAGYECSFTVQRSTGGKSAGRVQSAALRILADRETEIQNFKPEEYWDISAELITPRKEKFVAYLSKPDKMNINAKKEADRIVNDLRGSSAHIDKYNSKQVSLKPHAPFITSTLQQSASSILGWGPKKTMTVAQSLYANGLISYHRTDSTALSQLALQDLNNYIKATFATKYHSSSPRIYKKTVKNAQEAHEAIRPISVSNVSAGSTADEKKLYDLVWRRAVSSQMSNSESESIQVHLACKDKYELKASGSRTLFDGWKKVWTYSASADVILPKMSQNENCDIIDINAQQKFTQPPPRYSESSIVQKLEKTGIGRPSTFASILDTLKNREYIEIKKRAIHTTNLGVSVVSFMKDVNFCFVDTSFTANLENDLDNISNSKDTKDRVLDEFYKRLKKDLLNAQSIRQKRQISGHLCPDCGKNLLKKYSKYGEFLGCEDRKSCGKIMLIDEDGNPKEKPKKQYCWINCQKCKSRMVLRQSKRGEFYGCESFPRCKGMRTKEGEEIDNNSQTSKKTPKKISKKKTKKTSKKKTKKTSKKKTNKKTKKTSKKK